MNKRIATMLALVGCILLGNQVAKAETSSTIPMTFWGNATINGVPARAGTIIRAYYDTNTLAGEVTVQEAGIYGYSDTDKQKLVVTEGTGPITFTFQEDPQDRGGETAGMTSQTYGGFESGNSKNIDLVFILPPPPTPPDQRSHGVGEVLGASTTDPVALAALLNNLLTQVKSLEKQLVTQQFKAASCSLTFSQNLSQGMTNAAVKNLQTALNYSSLTQVAPSGAGSPGNESTYFGPATKNAVIAFQNIFSDEILTPAGLISGNGYVGAATRARLNLLCGH